MDFYALTIEAAAFFTVLRLPAYRRQALWMTAKNYNGWRV